VAIQDEDGQPTGELATNDPKDRILKVADFLRLRVADGACNQRSEG